MKNIVVRIQGMNCASCAINIEKVLKKEKGIAEVNVNFASEKIGLVYDPEVIKLAKVAQTVSDLGYELVIENGEKGEKPSIDKEREARGREVKYLKRRFVVSLIFGVPLLYFAMGRMVGLPVPFRENVALQAFIQLVLTTPVIIAAFKLYTSGFKSLLRKSPNMDSLVFIGTSVAYLYSIVITLAIWFKTGSYGVGSLYYEVAAFILVFILLGKYLEAVTKGRTSEALRKLVSLAPKKARVVRDGKEIEILAEEVEVGDIVVVKPGDKIPVDGKIIEGTSTIDESMITGESMPVDKKVGSGVMGATINKIGTFKFKATKVGKDTTLAQIVRIVEEAQASKAPIQLLADKVSLYFVPIVITIAALSFALWLLVGQPFSFALTILITVLIIACPCALGLATPTAVMMGTGLAAQNGILIKNSRALEVAQEVNMVVFDKTGTLTKGEPVVTDILPMGKDRTQVLQLAASIEKNSEHPLAQAVVNRAREEKLTLLEVQNFEAIPGKGVVAQFEDTKVLLGTKKLMSDYTVDVSVIEEEAVRFEDQGKTTMILAQDRNIIGIIAVADTLKEYSREAVGVLHKLGKEVAIITGDNKRVGEAIARQVGIKRVLAEVLPQEKSAEIRRLQKQGNVVAMVGDGINDAPALAQADLGIALGSGTDVAMETGEIILIKDDLRDVVKAINISKYTLRKIKQNLFWAFFYNSASIPIAAGLLYPLTGWLLNPAIAAATMAFSSVSVVFNALLMRGYKF